MKPAKKNPHDCRKGMYPSPRRFSISGPAPKASPVHCEELGGSFPTLPGRAAEAMAEVLKLKNTLKGKRSVLLVGAGPSGAQWEKHCTKSTYVVATNSAFGKIGKRADLLVCTEPAGVRHKWFTAYPDTPRVVTQQGLKDPNNMFVQEALKLPHLYPVAMSMHQMGFNPREYINPTELHRGLVFGKGEEGYDSESKKEYGLLQGTTCYPGRIHIGTVYVSALHLLAFMGAKKVKTIGFEFCTKDDVVHWTEPHYQHRPDPAIPQECFIEINDLKTLWHFALSAAWAVELFPVFEKAGMIVKDFSEGLMQIPEIASLLQNLADDPRSVYYGKEAKYQKKIQPRRDHESTANSSKQQTEDPAQ